jgi:hypothetical protein
VSTENTHPLSTASRSSRFGRVQPLRARVDLDRDAELPARLEHHLRVELRLPAGTATAGDQPPGAVAQDVGVRVGHRVDHPAGHRLAVHLQLGVHRGHDHVEAGQQLVLLVQRPSSRMSTSMPLSSRNGASAR